MDDDFASDLLSLKSRQEELELLTQVSQPESINFGKFSWLKVFFNIKFVDQNVDYKAIEKMFSMQDPENADPFPYLEALMQSQMLTLGWYFKIFENCIQWNSSLMSLIRSYWDGEIIPRMKVRFSAMVF